jgi:hypothetical protein
MEMDLEPLSPSSIWSFLTDSNYIHPLLSHPTPTSCHSIASSTGLLLKTKGLKVTAIKVDPYMNIDAGTMAPTEHGESGCGCVEEERRVRVVGILVGRGVCGLRDVIRSMLVRVFGVQRLSAWTA